MNGPPTLPLSITEGQRQQLSREFGVTQRRNPLLDRAMRALRQERPFLPPALTHTVHVGDGVGALWLQSPPCRFSLLGRCTMCDYWAGTRLENPARIAREALRSIAEWPETFVLNTCGSVLDPREMNREDLVQVMREVNAIDSIKMLILESHISTIDPSFLALLSDAAPSKQIAVEYGQESVSTDVLLLCLNKPSMIRSPGTFWDLTNGLSVPIKVNILIGSPFLTVKERINDAAHALISVLKAGADSVILFPANIKDYTLLHWLHLRSLYQPVNLSEVVHVISKLPPELIAKLSVVWYEGRPQTNPLHTLPIQPPERCHECGASCAEAIESFNDEPNAQGRLEIIKQAQEDLCDSCTSMTDLLDVRGSFFDRLRRQYARLSTELLGVDS